MRKFHIILLTTFPLLASNAYAKTVTVQCVNQYNSQVTLSINTQSQQVDIETVNGDHIFSATVLNQAKLKDGRHISVHAKNDDFDLYYSIRNDGTKITEYHQATVSRGTFLTMATDKIPEHCHLLVE